MSAINLPEGRKLCGLTVQVAPQEVELSSYLVGQINAEVSLDDLSGIEL